MICSCILKITAAFFWISTAIQLSILISWYKSFYLYFSSNLSSLLLCSFFNYVLQPFPLLLFLLILLYSYYCCWVYCILLKARVQTVAQGTTELTNFAFKAKHSLVCGLLLVKLFYLCFYTSLFYFIIFIYNYCCRYFFCQFKLLYWIQNFGISTELSSFVSQSH